MARDDRGHRLYGKCRLNPNPFCSEPTMNNTDDVISENEQTKLVITSDGIVKSLVFKPTNTECLIQGKKVPVSTITEPRPYQTE